MSTENPELYCLTITHNDQGTLRPACRAKHGVARLLSNNGIALFHSSAAIDVESGGASTVVDNVKPVNEDSLSVRFPTQQAPVYIRQ